MKSHFVGLLSAGAPFLIPHSVTAAEEAATLSAAIRATEPIVDTRLRYEFVDQDSLPDDAEAVTLRARLGFQTGAIWRTKLLAEGEFLWPLRDDYNSTLNGKTAFPVVADPESYEVNRVQLVNTSLPQTTVTLGRQRIILDNHRFVGDVGWRQNEQTYDALRVVNTSIANLTIDVSYLDQVNRVYGQDSPQGRYEGNTLLANLAYQLPIGSLTAFGYWLDFDPIAEVPAAASDSSETYGLRFAGERPAGKVKLLYAASWATQREYADNPLTFEDDYYLLELGVSLQQYSLGVGIEVLQGEGTKGFTTPLATLHKFQGWADKFLTTPVDGVEDRYVHAGLAFKNVGAVASLSGQVVYHDFQAERGSLDYGSEIDLQLQAKWQRFAAMIKYADYSADGFADDTTKFWLQFEYIW